MFFYGFVDCGELSFSFKYGIFSWQLSLNGSNNARLQCLTDISGSGRNKMTATAPKEHHEQERVI
jgi:hypothetical protein